MAASRKLAPVTIRDATRADLTKFYGEPSKQTVIARVGIVRGRLVGCGGVAYVAGVPFVFCDLKPSARRYKVTIVKAAAALIDEIRAKGCRVMFADLDPDEQGAERWTKRMGFKPTAKPGRMKWLA